jgi:hypothetical protein
LATRAAAVLAALAALAVGCGDDEPRAPAPPALERGPYVGRSASGVGASVDFAGFDAAARAVERALGGRRVEVGIASVVNEGSATVATPRFAAVAASGAATALVPARAALAGRAGPGAARARALLPAERRTLSPDRTAVLYLVLRAPSAEGIALLRMRAGTGEAAELRQR